VDCENTFRARSHKSREKKCWKCEPRIKNTTVQKKKRDDNMTQDAYKRLEKLEKHFKELEVAIDFLGGEANTIVTDIENTAARLLEQAVEKEVERLFDEKIQIIQSINERYNQTAQNMLDIFTKKLEKAKLDIPSPVVIEKEKLPELSKKKKDRLLRAEKYIMKVGPSTISDLVSTVWFDITKSTANNLAKEGVLHKYLSIEEKGKAGRGKATTYNVYQNPTDILEDTYMEELNASAYYGEDPEGFS
jgi:hypothetical protein